MQKWKCLHLSLFGLVSILILAGCSAPEIHPETRLEVQISEKGFTPDVLYVPAGKEITITLTNSTEVDHKWIILVDSYVNPFLQDPPTVYFQITVPAGETVNSTFLSPKSPIQLDVVCENEACIKAGMNALLVVVNQ
jgi:plastocyanin